MRTHANATQSAFTMIEIAISLAIIGFALVAIIGILPAGMNVQKDNRQETIVNQDASVFMNAIRNGERGLDDLTNYVFAITNYTHSWHLRGGRYVEDPEHDYGYTRLVSSEGVAPSLTRTTPQFPLISGSRIIGLMSTPKIIPVGGGFVSNHVVAFVRALSGPASEKAPQEDATVQGLALNYRLIPEVLGMTTNTLYDATWTNYSLPNLSTNEIVARSNYMRMVRTFETNLHDVRLTFRWPLNPNGASGPNRQSYRTLVGGALIRTNEFGLYGPHCTIYFFEPRTYFKGT
jgi:type II secretory pathway pseudopilin PulG